MDAWTPFFLFGWLGVGLATSLLTNWVARRQGLTVWWGWWIVYVVLGPIVPLLVAIIAIMAKRREKV